MLGSSEGGGSVCWMTEDAMLDAVIGGDKGRSLGSGREPLVLLGHKGVLPEDLSLPLSLLGGALNLSISELMKELLTP